jgi:cation transport protein ChaC
MLWTRDRIVKSLRATMRLRPDSADVWLFSYGSLIWNPLLYVSDSIPAELHSWHRSFCLRLIAGRGSAMTPGRMLSLEPGGKTAGLALRLHASDLEEELRLVWRREMLTGAYVPTWVQLKLHDERRVWAIAFVADPAHRLYEADASVGSVARLVAHASGPLGTNVDYVFRLKHALQRHGLSDALCRWCRVSDAAAWHSGDTARRATDLKVAVLEEIATRDAHASEVLWRGVAIRQDPAREFQTATKLASEGRRS